MKSREPLYHNGFMGLYEETEIYEIRLRDYDAELHGFVPPDFSKRSHNKMIVA